MSNLDNLTPAQIDHRCRLAWKAGVKAATSGKPITKNDRPRCTVFYDDWADGYLSIANNWPNDKYTRLVDGAARSAKVEDAPRG